MELEHAPKVSLPRAWLCKVLHACPGKVTGAEAGGGDARAGSWFQVCNAAYTREKRA